MIINNRRYKGWIIIGCLFIFTSIVAENKLGHNLSKISKPIKAPDFSLVDMDEIQVSLSEYKGRVILLNFWATWCPPCKKELPSMERLHQHFKGKQFAVIAINQMESIDHVFAFTGELDTDPEFSILFDKDSKVSEKYRVLGLPSTYLIDKKGYLRYRAIGGREFDDPEVVSLINRLMQE